MCLKSIFKDLIKNLLIPVAVLMLILLTSISQLQAATFSYSENFSTTTYKDNINTTANWNTAVPDIEFQFIGLSSSLLKATTFGSGGGSGRWASVAGLNSQTKKIIWLVLKMNL